MNRKKKQGVKTKKCKKSIKKGLLQNCFPVSAATVLINISLKTIHAGGFRCAPEERGITACGLAHRLWIYPRFCALQERGSGLTVASLPHFMCRRLFRIPHSAFRIPHSAFRIPHSAFRIPHSAFRIPHSAFRIPHSAFRIPHSACLFYTQK